MSTTLSRRLLTIIPVDAATVAIGLPAAFVDFYDHSEQTEERGAVIANTGVDGGYRAYEVLDGTGTVVGQGEVKVPDPTSLTWPDARVLARGHPGVLQAGG